MPPILSISFRHLLEKLHFAFLYMCSVFRLIEQKNKLSFLGRVLKAKEHKSRAIVKFLGTYIQYSKALKDSVLKFH